MVGRIHHLAGRSRGDRGSRVSRRDRASIIASLKAQKAAGGSAYRGGSPDSPSIGTGLSPLVQQYQQYTTGRTPASYLPRPADEYLTGGFGPLTPIEPMPIDAPEESGRADPRRYVYRVGWNLPVGEPGIEGLKLADFNTLRTLADLYSVARACIRLRKQELRSVGWDIIPTKEAEKRMRGDRAAHADFHERRDQAVKFFRNPDPEYGTFSSWIDAILEEVLVFDALSIHIAPYWGTGKGLGLLGSDIKALELLNGPTIRPLLDLHGARPRAPLPAYQQYIYGVPRTDLTQVITERDLIGNPELSKSRIRDYRGDQLIYAPYTRRTWTPYGFPPIEQALIPTISGLRKQGYQLDFFAEGTVPAAYISPGDSSMTPQQIRELQDALNAIAGDTAYKHKIIVLPPGSKIDPQKPVDLADKFDDVVMNQVCMAFDVMPMELGITPSHSTGGHSGGAANQMHKMSEDANDRRARLPMLLWLKETIFDKVIQQVCGQHDMQWTWEGLEEDEDEKTQTDLVVEQISNGLLSIDEGRIELGKSPWGLPITSDPGFIVQGSFTPLGSYNPTTEKPGDEPGEATGPTPPTGPTSTPPAAPTATPTQESEGTPSHEAGDAGGKPTQDVQPPKATPVRKALHQGQLSELDALRRHLNKGRTLESWIPKHLEKSHLDMVTAALLVEGNDPNVAIPLVKTMFATDTVKAGSFDPTKRPRGAAGSTSGGQFVSGTAGATHVGAPLVRPTKEQEAVHQAKVKKPKSGSKKVARRKRITAKQRAERAAQKDKIKALRAKLDAERQKAKDMAALHRQALTSDAHQDVSSTRFRAIGKANRPSNAQPPEWPGWDFDLELVVVYAKKIGAALSSAISGIRDKIIALIKGGATAPQVVTELEQSIRDAIDPVLRDMWAESWLLGDRSAVAKVIGGAADWSDWVPGDPEAALLVIDRAAFDRLLDSYGISGINSIADSYMAAAAGMLHDAVERGLSADELARQLRDLVASPERSKTIAQTEIARVVSKAAEERYKDAGIDQVEWITAEDERVCPICDANEASGPVPVGSPFPSGTSSPPGHPHCRCVIIPAEPDYGSDDTNAYLGKAEKPKHQSAYEQMLEDYPPDAIQWMHDAHWEGPTRVPAASVDFSDDAEWQASHEREKVERFKKKIKKKLGKGKPIKPVVLIKTPKNDKFTVIDGHHRSLAYKELGEPLVAWVGHVDREKGPWLETHSSQYPESMRDTTDDDTKDASVYSNRVEGGSK